MYVYTYIYILYTHVPWSKHGFFVIPPSTSSKVGHVYGHEFVCLMVVSTSTTGSNSCSQVPNRFQIPNLPVKLGFWMVKIFPTKPLHCLVLGNLGNSIHFARFTPNRDEELTESTSFLEGKTTEQPISTNFSIKRWSLPFNNWGPLTSPRIQIQISETHVGRHGEPGKKAQLAMLRV